MRKYAVLGLILAAAILAARPGARPAMSGLAYSAGMATFTASTAGGSTPVGSVTDVTLNLTSFTPGTDATWGGYDMEVSYDGNVVTATADVVHVSSPCKVGPWGLLALVPHVASACLFQSSVYTGPLETITFMCLTSGTSSIHFVLPTDDDVLIGPASLFDTSGVGSTMTMVDGSITCGASATPTPSATDTPTPTSTPTPTLTATPTPTFTSTPAVRSVGGIAEAPSLPPSAPTGTESSSGGDAPPRTGIISAAAVVLIGAAWYARRRLRVRSLE